MNNPLIMVGSVTYAIKGRDLLRRMGYRASMERTPAHLNRVGCGYSITVEDLDAIKASRILEENGIKVYGVSDGDTL